MSNRLPVDVASVDGALCILLFLPADLDKQNFLSFSWQTSPARDSEHVSPKDTWKLPYVQAVNSVLLIQQWKADLDLSLIEFPLHVRMSTVVINSELDENVANKLIKGETPQALSTAS